MRTKFQKNKLYTYIKKFMSIILSIYSKNANSLTNFLKFFYKLKKEKFLKLKFYTKQSQKKKNSSLISVLQSPHVNKKSQEQFEYYVYSKQLKIQAYQLTKFLFIWKWIKTKLFFDIKIKTNFLLNEHLFNDLTLEKTDYEKFIPISFNKKKFDESKIHKRKFSKKSKTSPLHFSSITKQTSLKLADIQGEKLLKFLL